MAGRFIVLEGLDGSGLHELGKWIFDLLLERYGLKERWLTKEPSGGPVGLILRLGIDGRLDVAPEALALFFAADRADHLFRSDGIMQRLNKGESVICDRYYLSSYAYQTSDHTPGSDEFNQRLAWLRAVNERWYPPPDLTLFIDQPPESCVQRLLDEQRELGYYQATKIDLERPATWEQAKSRLNRIRMNYLSAIEVVSADSERKENIKIIGSGDTEFTWDKVRKEATRELDKLFKT